MKMTDEQIEARMEAFYQVTTLLEGSWTDNKVEQEQGEKLREQLQKMADNWYNKVTSNR